MTDIENYYSIARRQGIKKVPIQFFLCPHLRDKFADYLKETNFKFKMADVMVPDLSAKRAAPEAFKDFLPQGLKDGTVIDSYGVAHEPGSAAAFHMKKMHYPMAEFDSVEQVLTYPFPDYLNADDTAQIAAIKKAHDDDRVAVGRMECTVWERAWYMRGMENLMVDMLSEDPIAEAILDKVTDISVLRAQAYARNGVDLLRLGDDIGMQHSIMMSEELYCAYIKPRLKRVIAAAKAINPNILVFYHSCGFITPMIPHLIEAGVDILDPIQPECMSFEEIHERFGNVLSFNGTIGTQSTMPFGTPDDVRREVFKNLDIAGSKGGLFVCPTHILEPEVPVENLVAYIKACQDYM